MSSSISGLALLLQQQLSVLVNLSNDWDDLDRVQEATRLEGLQFTISALLALRQIEQDAAISRVPV